MKDWKKTCQKEDEMAKKKFSRMVLKWKRLRALMLRSIDCTANVYFFFVFSHDPIPKCHQSQFSGTTHLSHQKPLPLAESHLWHKTSEWCTNTISVVRHHPIKLKFPLNWHSEMNSRFYWLEWSCRYLFENDLILLCPYSPFPSEHLKNFYINSDF